MNTTLTYRSKDFAYTTTEEVVVYEGEIIIVPEFYAKNFCTVECETCEDNSRIPFNGLN